MNGFLIAAYIVGVLAAYAGMRIFCFEMEDGMEEIVMSWMAAILWPAALPCLLVLLLLFLIGKLVDAGIRRITDLIIRR